MKFEMNNREWEIIELYQEEIREKIREYKYDGEPKDNFIFEPLEYVEKKTINNAKKCDNLSHQKMRSMIHPQYARRFIMQYIIDEKEIKTWEEK